MYAAAAVCGLFNLCPLFKEKVHGVRVLDMKFGLTRIFDEISYRIQYGIFSSCLAMSKVSHRNDDHEISRRLPL